MRHGVSWRVESYFIEFIEWSSTRHVLNDLFYGFFLFTQVHFKLCAKPNANLFKVLIRF